MNAISNTCMALFLMAVMAGCIGWIVQRPAYALQTVRVQSLDGSDLHHVSAQSVRNIVLPSVQGNFFTVDLNEVKAAFETVPWVRVASVRREWPDKLVVSLEEHQPLGVWGQKGQLLSTKGELFTVNMAEAEEEYDLLKFGGPEGSEKEVWERYKEFCRQFADIHLVPKEVMLSDRYAWSVRLDNGMNVEFGRENDENTLNELMNRLKDAYPQIEERTGGVIENIDMRYPNGLALKVRGSRPVSGTQQNDVAL